MDLKEYCVNVAREQFGKSRKLDSGEERLKLIRAVLEQLDKVRNDLCQMSEVLQDLEAYEKKEEAKLEIMLGDMDERENGEDPY